MKPVVFTIPFLDRDVPGYGLMLMVGFLLAIWWAARRAAKSRGNPDVILNCGFVALITGVIGCRLMYVVHYWDQFKYRGNWIEILWAIVDVTKGGLEFYGGFVLTSICVFLWLRYYEKVSIRWYLDIIAPSAALGLAIGRIGCFLNGCCYGGPCELPWAMRFPYGSNPALYQWQAQTPGAELPEQLLFTHSPGVTTPLTREFLRVSDEEIAAIDARQAKAQKQLDEIGVKLAGAPDASAKARLERDRDRAQRQVNAIRAEHLVLRANMKKYGMSVAELQELAAHTHSNPVHPTQLYSTITALIIAFFLNALYWRRTRDGQVILTLFLIEPVTRWLIEVIRVDNPTDTLSMFTISQFIAVCMTVIGLVGLLLLRKFPARSPRAVPWEPEPEKPKSAEAAKQA